MSQALNQKCRGLGPNAGPTATESQGHTGQWAFFDGNEPGQMFIQELRKTGFGPQRVAQRIHSLTFHPAAFLASSHSLRHQGPAGSAICAGECPTPHPVPHSQKQSQKRGELGAQDTPRPPDPPSQVVFSAIFGVDYGEATSSAFILDTQNMDPTSALGELPAIRWEADVKQGEE